MEKLPCAVDLPAIQRREMSKDFHFMIWDLNEVTKHGGILKKCLENMITLQC